MGIGGDFDRDGSASADDVDRLIEAIAAGTNDPRFNLTSDVVVDSPDLDAWVHKVKNTYYGDANLDGEFNSSDLTAVFKSGEYEDSIVGNSTWAEGDWNANGDFESGDLIVAFQDLGYEAGPRAALASVPEPATFTMLFSLVVLLRPLARRTIALRG